MHDPKRESRPPTDTENSSEPVQWQTNNRAEEKARETRDVETDRKPPSDVP
jgi:hypothetical protein